MYFLEYKFFGGCKKGRLSVLLVTSLCDDTLK